MNIISVSFNGHDSGITFLVGGKHYKTVLEERLTTVKQDQTLFSVFEHVTFSTRFHPRSTS